MLNVTSSTLHQVEKFKYIGMIFTSDGDGTNRLIHV